MHSLSKRGQGATVPVIIGLVLGLVFLFAVFSIYGIVQTKALNVETVTQTGCWLSNTVKCGEGLFTFWPSLCAIDVKEEPLGKEDVAIMIRDTWWMYKQGSCDFGNTADEIFPVYVFEPNEDISITGLIDYMRETNRGRTVSDLSKSDYNYIEEGSRLHTLCFDISDKEGIANGRLAKGEEYYIIYYDDQSLIEVDELIGGVKSDSILISNNPSFDKGYFEDIAETAAFGALTAGGYSVASTTGGIGIPIVTTIGASATGAYNLYKITTQSEKGDEQGCLIYQ